MSVLLETTEGNIVIDLFTKQSHNESYSFLKLCKLKYYHYSPFVNVQKDFIIESGNSNYPNRPQSPLLLESVGNSQFNYIISSKSQHNDIGIVSFLNISKNSFDPSKFLITLTNDQSMLKSLDSKASPFGQIMEGFTTLEKILSTPLDDDRRPLKDCRILHTHIIDDPYPDPDTLTFQNIPSTPLPTQEQISSFRLLINSDDDLSEDEEDDNNVDKINKLRELQSASHSLTLSLLGDLPNPSIQPSPLVLFICKLNPITGESDLELIFQRFGAVKSIEIIRDKITRDSLCYGFIEFYERKSVEEAYLKMNDVLIDDRRIGVDFSQSVKKSNNYRSSRANNSDSQPALSGNLRRDHNGRDAVHRRSSNKYSDDRHHSRSDRDRKNSSSSHGYNSASYISDRHSSDAHSLENYRSNRHSSDKYRSDRERSERDENRERERPDRYRDGNREMHKSDSNRDRQRSDNNRDRQRSDNNRDRYRYRSDGRSHR